MKGIGRGKSLNFLHILKEKMEKREKQLALKTHFETTSSVLMDGDACEMEGSLLEH